MRASKAKWTETADSAAMEILKVHALALREVAEHVAERSDAEYVSPANVVSASAALKLAPPSERLADILSNVGLALFGLGGGAALATISSATPAYNGWFVAALVTAMIALPIATTGVVLKMGKRG